MTDCYVIRTSDRQFFKKCRTLWDFGSKIRQNYEPLFSIKPLDFGTAFHRGLQTYYDPKTWDMDREVVKALSIQSFVDVCDEQKRHYTKVSVNDISIDLEIDFKERVQLGKDMLNFYFDWAVTKDTRLYPKLVEIEFEVPVMVPDSLLGELPIGFTKVDGQLYFRNEPVVYQGRVDLVVEDEFGEYWIWDHKTAASFGTTTHLALDEQCGSYIWALKYMLNLNVAGVVYNEVRKKVPHPPLELKKGGLSVNKQQDTTYDLFMKAIKDGGYSVEAYQGHLDYLQENPKEFVRRTQIHRNTNEMAVQERRICLEAIDMLNSPSIYPNPTKWNCDGCWFYSPCLATQEAGDVEFTLKELFRVRNHDEN